LRCIRFRGFRGGDRQGVESLLPRRISGDRTAVTSTGKDTAKILLLSLRFILGGGSRCLGFPTLRSPRQHCLSSSRTSYFPDHRRPVCSGQLVAVDVALTLVSPVLAQPVRLRATRSEAQNGGLYARDTDDRIKP